MRRFLPLALLAAAALAAAAPALAKRTRVAVVPLAAAPRAGVAWPLRIRVRLDGKPYARRGYRPLVGVLDARGGLVASFRGSAATRPGEYVVRVVFPRPGRWRYSVADPIMGDWFFAPVRVR